MMAALSLRSDWRVISSATWRSVRRAAASLVLNRAQYLQHPKGRLCDEHVDGTGVDAHHGVVGEPFEPRPVEAIDVRGVAEALDDGDRDTTWWYDPSTGQVEPGVSEWMAAEFGDDDEPEDRGLVPIDSQGSRAAYGDMATFASAVSDRRAGDLLQRALEGRGAFRRFRDTLHEFEDLVGPWRAYAQARSELRALDWLGGEGHVDPADAEVAMAMATRDAAASSVLEAVGHASSLRLDVTELAGRWADIERAVDAGHEVVLLRGGEPWATITPT